MSFTKSLLLSIFVSTIAHAADALSVDEKNALEVAVAYDMDSLVGETVNEGENEAYLLLNRAGRPNSSCQFNILSGETGYLLTCDVEFKVKVYGERKLQKMTCSSLTYQATPGKEKIVKYGKESLRLHYNLRRSDDSSFDSCVETLNEGV